MQCRTHPKTFLAAARCPFCFHLLSFVDVVSSLPVRAQIWLWFVLIIVPEKRQEEIDSCIKNLSKDTKLGTFGTLASCKGPYVAEEAVALC
ncbi:uncharacterized protein [Triticum aestivum]|nr:uncharacterized protein LOC123136582 isoform X3 [Triticum aestivum]